MLTTFPPRPAISGCISACRAPAGSARPGAPPAPTPCRSDLVNPTPPGDGPGDAADHEGEVLHRDGVAPPGRLVRQCPEIAIILLKLKCNYETAVNRHLEKERRISLTG